MKQLLILSFFFSFIVLSCNDDKTGDPDNPSPAPDSTLISGAVSGDSTASLQVDADGDTLKLLPSEAGLAWVQEYQKMVDNNESMSLRKIPNMIWLSKTNADIYLWGNDKIKLCLAVDPDDTTREVVVLVQVRKKGGPKKFKYYQLKRAEKIKDEDAAFCPLPYPCATNIEPIEN